MSRCIYSLKEFDHASGEHILQNFLGARWTSNRISCDEVQHSFGITIDTALESGLKEIRVVLGHKGGRGGSGPTLKNVSTLSGKKVHVSPGGAPSFAEPIVSVEEYEDGSYGVSAKLGTEKHFGWALNKLRQEFSHLNLQIDEEALKNSFKHGEDPPSEPMHLRSKMGGLDFFRGALKSCFNLLGAIHHDIAISDDFNDLRRFILDSGGCIDDFVRWMPNADALDLPAIGQFDHLMGLIGYAGSVTGVIQFYGQIAFPVRLSSDYHGRDFQCSYVVDPFRENEPSELRNDSQFRFDSIPIFDQLPTKPETRVWDGYSRRIKRVLERWHARTDKINIRDIVDSVLLPKDGEILDEATLRELSRKLAEYIAVRTVT